MTLHDNCIVVADGDHGGSEGDITTGIAELTNGEERLSGKLWDHMSMVRCRWEAREIQLSFVGGVQNGTRRHVDGNGVGRWAFVTHRSGWRKEVGGAAQISYGIKWSGGRTGGIGRMTKASGVRLN